MKGSEKANRWCIVVLLQECMKFMHDAAITIEDKAIENSILSSFHTSFSP